MAMANAPSLIYLSEPLPSSVEPLGLSLADFPLNDTAATPPAARSASSSFRVRSIHLDDVAEDVILVCEDDITLFIPFTWGTAAAAPSNLEKHSKVEKEGIETAHDTACCLAQDSALTAAAYHRKYPPHARGALFCSPSPYAAQTPRSSTPTASAGAAAACLRMANSSQVWSHPPPASCCTTASTSGLCLPRRLPVPREEFRRLPSVLMAVPLPPSEALLSCASSSGCSATPGRTSGPLPASDSSALTAPPLVMAVCIMECPVLPEGVDSIEASAVPLARPLAKVICSPNTLRFREARYPIQFFCWCDSNKDSAAPVGASASMTTSAAHVDHHLLCVSSIAVDLIQVRCRAGTALSPQPPQTSQVSTKSSPLLSCGFGRTRENELIERETARAPSVSSVSVVTADSMTPSVFRTPSTTGGVCDRAAMVSISVLQRYVTRSDWCTYDARSRMLLSLNRARPSVVKPIKVCVRREAFSVDNELGAKLSITARVGSPPLELRTLAELTLPESLCATVHVTGATAQGTTADTAGAFSELPLLLLQCPKASQQLASVLGALTIYGQSFVYHVSSGRDAISGQQCPVMNLYMYVPSKEHGCEPLFAMSKTERALGSRVTSAGAPASAAEAARSDSLLSRLTAVASSATSSAPPPTVCDGMFVHAARLSLAAVMSRASCDSQAPMQDLSPDAVETDARAAPFPQMPGLVPLCVQVVDNLIVIHAPDTARSAVYDLADDSSSAVPRMSAATASRNTRKHTSVRDYALNAVSSGAIGAGIWVDEPTAGNALNNAASANYSSEPAPSRAEEGTTSSSRGMASSGFECFQLSQPNRHSGSSIADDTGHASAATSRSLLLPSPAPSHTSDAATDFRAAERRQHRDCLHSRRIASQHQAPSADFTSMLFVLSRSVLAMTASVPTTTAATAASAVPLMYPLYCCSADAVVKNCAEGGVDDSEDASWNREPVVYRDYQWLPSARSPLVIKTSDGTVRVCRVDAARVAAWCWLVDARRERDRGDQPLCPLPQEQGLDENAPSDEAALGLVRSHVSFLCRRHQAFLACSTRHCRTSSAHALASLLGKFTGQVVGLEGNDGDDSVAGVSLTGPTEHSAMDALRHFPHIAIASTLGVAGKQLYALWMCMLESLTLATSFHDRCVAVERERALALTGSVVGVEDADASSSEASDGLPMNSAELQRLILQKVFAPTWEAVHSSLPSHPQQQHHLQRRRQLEGLLCDYVRLLHSAAIPVEPSLQRFLLKMVLWGVDETLASPVGPLPLPSVSSAGRRVRELLRQGVLEPNDATARWLLDWWGASQEMRASIGRIDIADTNWRHLNACESSAERHAELSGTVASAASFAAAPTPTPQQCADVPFASFGPDDAEEAEELFSEAVRLLEAHGFLLEVAEAHICRSDFTAAAAVLQRVSQQRRYNEVPVVAPSPTLAHRRQTRALSWDSLALSVLDGAWQRVRWAEEALFSNAGGALETSQHQLTASAFASNPWTSWRKRSLERHVQAAHRVYMGVAQRLLVKPTVSTSVPLPEIEAAHLSQVSLAATTSSNVDGRFYTHEIHYEQLLRHVEQAWNELKQRGGA
ncbi:hypothetical protein, conserved [Leishmania tarentolae]|uniref:Uncharacterized protein n=1 Tax=Leishmania tarentolae TaxID=5689 RepID=A0A640KDU0_LEITA|nr:hypothetical protein, conserved [Leishmania tarentolae]